MEIKISCSIFNIDLICFVFLGSTIIILALCATVVFSHPVNRSVDLSNPCFVFAKQIPSPSNGVPLRKSIKDLIARTLGLKIEARNIQTYVSDL
jgi:hypothetical protein